jgi:NitT/TauT family transport system permease protein
MNKANMFSKPVAVPVAAAAATEGTDDIYGGTKPAVKRDRTALIAPIVVAILLGIVMEIASRFVPDYIMPSPVTVMVSVKEILFRDLGQVAVTLGRLGMAIGFSMVVGVAMGLFMGASKKLGPYMRALVIIDTGIPALSWMLVAVFWFKDAETRIFFILTVILLPFYALNVYEGMKAIPKDWIDMMESFRPSRWQMMRYLIIPHIISYIFLTTKSVIGYAIRMVIFAELVASAVGIGARMSLAQSTFRIDQVLAWTFLLVLLNLLFQWFVGYVERHALKWRAEVKVR